MQIINIEQGSEEWLEYRKGKITGTRLGDIFAKRGGRKIGFYDVIADRLALDPDDENRMDRGLRLEEEAIKVFTEKTGKKVERVGLCVSEVNPNIINSPDGLIKVGKKYKEAIEIKCLSPARHLQAVIENVVPGEFEAQKIQYFVVNPDLEKLHFVFYDPRIASVPFHVIEVTRESLGNLPQIMLDFQIEQLGEIDELVERLSF